jgi:hypothetical protein
VSVPMHRGRKRRITLLFAALLAVSGPAFGQETLDYNTYYRFPVSLGVEYQSLSPFADYGGTFNLFDISLGARIPLPGLPILQPALRFGMLYFDSQDAAEPRKWDHSHWYGMAGLAAAHRFAKSFELGGELLAGGSLALFPYLLPEEGTVSTTNLLVEAGVRIGLDPAYNFSVEVHPSVRYLYSFGPLPDFNAFIFGLGFTASYRFGQDPDAPAAVIRAIRFGTPAMPSVFAAMQSWYTAHPAGKVTITNTEKAPLTEVKVTFFQAGYMDSPTVCPTAPELAPGESRDVGLLASFNQEVFRTEGVTPLAGEITVSYKARGRAVEQKQAVSYDLQDKSAISWDDDRKVAAFITPADSALRNYASFIRQSCKAQAVAGLNEPLQFAIQAFRALGVIGVLYQADPALPFTAAKGNPEVVDSVSLPRDTLKRITGDCDDLTVLYCSLLETVGIETGFITVPGHIYAAFNTRLPGRDFKRLHPDRSLSLTLGGDLWVPVEITMIGKSGFLEAWRKAAEEWNGLETAPEKRTLYRTRAAQELYRPVGLKEADLGLQYGRKEDMARGFSEDLDRLVEAAVAEYSEAARKGGRAQDWNRLGIAYGRYARYPQAERAFREALRADPVFLSPRVNLGNLYLLKGDFAAAQESLAAAWKDVEKTPDAPAETVVKVLLNLSRACYQLEHFEQAKRYFDRAQSLDPKATAQYAYLAERSAGGSEGRGAAQPGLAAEVLFVGEED